MVNRNIIYVLTALMIVVSCSDEVSVSPYGGQEQADEVAVNVECVTQKLQTRAGVSGTLDDAALQRDGVGVFGYYTGTNAWSTYRGALTTTLPAPNFMYNQEVNYESVSKEWVYEPQKYWPNENLVADNQGAIGAVEHNYLSFLAYAPYSGNSVTLNDVTYTFVDSEGRFKSSGGVYYDAQPKASGILRMTANGATGDPLITYRLAEKATDLVDLLWGTRGKTAYAEADGTTANNDEPGETTLNTDLTKQTTDEKVKFIFRHTLASIDIYVRRIYDEEYQSDPAATPPTEDTRIFVSELKLAVSDMCKEATFNLVTGEWTEVVNDDYTLTIDSTRIRSAIVGSQLDNSHINEVRGMELNGFTAREGVTEAMTRLTNETYSTMFIPISGNDGVTMTPTISYSFVTQDDAEELGLSDEYGTHNYARVLNKGIPGSAVTIGTYDSVGDSYTLERGKRYVLVCNIGAESVQFVLTSVEDWDFPIRMGTTVNDYTADDAVDKTVDEE